MNTLLLTLLVMAQTAAEQAVATFGEVKIGEASEEIDDMYLYWDDTPGCAVLVVHEGKVVHAAGYGFANLEEQTPFAPDTSTRLGSVSKQFTTMGIMILAERGKLGYDDPLVKYVPEVEARHGDDITIRHLMNHTSGIPDYTSIGGVPKDDEGEPLLPDDRMPVNEDLAHIYAHWGEARFEPGERFEYSNPGYEFLALIIERVSGKSFGDFMADEIFTPLEMKGAMAFDSDDDVIPNRAMGYQPQGDEFTLNDYHVLNWMMGAGGIYMSLQDMFLWDQALYSDQLVSQETIEQAFTPAVLNDGEEVPYGFGWGVDDFRDGRRIRHGGGWVGFRTHIARHPEHQLTVVVLANRGDAQPSRFVDEIAELYLGEEE